MTNRQKRKIIREATKYILNLLEEGDHVIIRGFGTFRVVDKKARRIRNIRTGQIITVPSHTTVAFKASKKLRDYFPSVRVNNKNSKMVEMEIPQEEINKAWEEFYRSQAREEAQEGKEFRKMILNLGGIWDRDYESIPRWARRKKGHTLSEICDELNEFGTFGHFDPESLYDALWDHTLALR